MAFLIAAVRALVELIGLCLLAQGALRLLAGPACASNAVYRFFALVTLPPRRLVAKVMPRAVSEGAVSVVCFLLLLFLWLGLAWVRKML